MINSLRPRGALLAAFALWSLCVLLLAVAGLGAQVGLHPANAALAPPVPVVQLDSIGARLGPPEDYAEIGERPLFSRDRRPVAVMASGDGNADAPLEVVLTSVLISGDFKMAILQGREDARSHRLRLGEVLEGTGWQLVELMPRSAVFQGPQGRRELELRVFDGQGGAPPTPITTVAASEPGAAPGAAPGLGGGKAPAVPTASTGALAAPQDAAASAAPVTPEQQVEAIRRRIEARRAMRAAQAEQDQVPPAAPTEQVQ